MTSRPTLAALKLLDECGISEPLQLSVEMIINSRNLMIKEEAIDGAEGRIVMNENSGVITVDSKITFPAKRCFVLAHELGHFELHRGLKKFYSDDEDNLIQWYGDSFGAEESEANDFASEFLMPSGVFSDECKGKKFGPVVIDHLSNRFQVSKTAAILRFVKQGNHPICVVCCKSNRMKWWKRSEDFRYFLNFGFNREAPANSVAYEIFTTPNRYYGDEQQQTILKSTWFELRREERESAFYEFCLYASSYGYTLSVLWED